MGSKSKIEIMKLYKNIKKEAAPTTRKKENAQDIISKSLQKTMTTNDLKSSDCILINQTAGRHVFKYFIMGTLKNHVQLIGNVGQEPTIVNLENGKKVARFSMATNAHYRNADGDKNQTTDWHTVVAWGKAAEFIKNHVSKGKKIGVRGKLRTRAYATNDGSQRYATEVELREILLLGNKKDS